MGLDLVELVMEVEDEFGIQIPDEAASKTQTVGDLYRLVLELTGQAWMPPSHNKVECESRHLFYQLRQGIMSALGPSKKDIKPSTSLAAIFPVWTRQPRWARVAHAAKLSLPNLRRPFGAAMIVLFTSTMILWQFYRRDMFGLLPFVLMVAGIGTACSMGVALWWELPLGCRRVGDLVRILETGKVGNGAGRQHETWVKLRRIICEQLDISPDRVSEHARFIEDLGAG